MVSSLSRLAPSRPIIVKLPLPSRRGDAPSAKRVRKRRDYDASCRTSQYAAPERMLRFAGPPQHEDTGSRREPEERETCRQPGRNGSRENASADRAKTSGQKPGPHDLVRFG